MPDATLKCGNCGGVLDERQTPPGGLAKCPRCGATTDVGAARPPYEFPFLGLMSLLAGAWSLLAPHLRFDPGTLWLGPVRGALLLAAVAVVLATVSLFHKRNWLAWAGALLASATVLYLVLKVFYERSTE